MGSSGPDNKGKGNEYVTRLVVENGCLPYKMVLVMLTTLPGVGSNGYQSHQSYPDTSARQISVLMTANSEIVVIVDFFYINVFHL